MNKLLYPANENGTYDIPVTFRDRDNSIVSDARVESVTVSLQNREGDYIVNRPVAAVGVQSVSLSGNDLQIQDQAKAQELRLFTVDAVVDSRPVHMEWEMYVKNLSVFSEVGSNIQWRDELNNSVGVYSLLTAPAFDYGYVCNGGVLVKAMSSESTIAAPTDPTFVSQCDDGVTTWPPASFADLVGIPCSDEFTGLLCNSGEIDDTNWLLRGWVGLASSSGASSAAIVADTLEHSVLSGGPTAWYRNSIAFDHAGEFEFEIDCTGVGASATKFMGYLFRVTCGAHMFSFGIEQISGSLSYYQASGEALVNLPTVLYAPHKLKITRQSDNKVRFYVGDVLVGTSSGTYTDNASAIYVYSNSQEPTTQKFKYDYLTGKDGTGSPIYIPIAGQSCT